jgi:serine/threonine protein phosphatase PrpC
MTERGGFRLLTPAQQALRLSRHKGNQDSVRVTPSGLYVSDGVSTTHGGEFASEGGKLASQTAVDEISSYVEDAGISEQSPRRAKRTLAEAAAHADDIISRQYPIGSAAVVAAARTGNPNVIATYVAGDARLQQNRNGKVLFQTAPQNVVVVDRGQPREIVSNTLNGMGRPTRSSARAISRHVRKQYGA